MWKVQILGLALIVDLLLHTFHFIQIKSKNDCPNDFRIIPNGKGMLAFNY